MKTNHFVAVKNRLFSKTYSTTQISSKTVKPQKMDNNNNNKHINKKHRGDNNTKEKNR